MKWSFSANNFRGAQLLTRKVNKRWLLAGTISVLFISSIATFLLPTTSYADTGQYNILQLLGENCHDLHEITHNFSQYSGDSRCHDGDGGNGWQEVLNDDLGCSDGMFYQYDKPTDPNDPSVTTTLWYTHEADYKDCYNKAQTMFNHMTDPNGDCKLIKKDSDNYKNCTADQDNLNATLGCDSSMLYKIADGDPHAGYYTVKTDSAPKNCQQRIDDVGKVKIYIIGSDGKPVQNTVPISDSSVASNDGSATGDAGNTTGTLGCDASGNPLSWIICPIINDVLVPAISATDTLITNEMNIPQQTIFCTTTSASDDSCQAYYTAWATFRNIALGLMTIAGLIIVISQAIGMEILDAYTVRKTLPRILVAAIAITLSWTLMSFAVTLSNNLGFGVRDLIIAPFHSLSTTISIDSLVKGSGLKNGIENFFGTGLVAAAGVTIWTAAGGMGVLISYIATAGLAVLIAVLVLVLRQIAIVMLMLLSPLALVAYVLPNTQRIFKLWWESFSKALLMFPLIAAFITTGRVFAAISLSQNSSGANSILQGIIGFSAYFAPYFLIPLTFRLAGGAMSGLGNFVSQRGQGVSGALSGYRSNQMKQRVARARTEGLYRPGFGKFTRPFARDSNGNRKTTSVGKMLNRTGFWGLNADEMIPMKLGTTTLGGLKKKPGIPGFRRGGQGLLSEIQRSKRDQTVKAAQDLDIGYKSGRLMAGEFQYYDSSLTAAGHEALVKDFGIVDPAGNFQGYRAPDTWGERTKVADIFSTQSKAGEAGREAREAGGELKGTASEFEKYTKSPETNRVDGRFLGLISAAKSGRLEIDEVTANHNRWLAEGNQEQAVRETTILQDALTQKRVSAARGHGIAYAEDGKAYNVYKGPNGKTSEGAFSDKAADSLSRISTGELAQIKSEDLDNEMAEAWVANASDHKMTWGTDPYTGEERVVFDKSGGQTHLKSDPKEAERAREIQNRLKSLAMYNQGDTDVGRKVAGIWERIGGDPRELDFGASRDPNNPNTPVGGGGATTPPTPAAPAPPAPGGP